MTMPVPATPKIYHIVHVDRLPTIFESGSLWSDMEIAAVSGCGNHYWYE